MLDRKLSGFNCVYTGGGGGGENNKFKKAPKQKPLNKKVHILKSS